MKQLFNTISIFALLVALTSASVSFSKASSKAKGPSLKTDVSFDGRIVGGKRQNTPESITTVENDKSLDDLIGVRKNFKDRLERSEELR